MGTVVAVITSMLLLLNLLNNPFHDGVGGLQPVAMERTLQVIDEELGDRAASTSRCRATTAATRSVGAHGELVSSLPGVAPGPRLARRGAAGRVRRPAGGPRAGAGAGARPRPRIAAPLMPALGAAFAIFAALTLAGEAGYLRAAEDLVSDEAAAASRLAWAATSPGVDAEPIQTALHDYLLATRAGEWRGRRRSGADEPATAPGHRRPWSASSAPRRPGPRSGHRRAPSCWPRWTR